MSAAATLAVANAALAAALAARAIKAHVPGDVPEDHEDNTFGLPNGSPIRKQLRAMFLRQLKKIIGTIPADVADLPDSFPPLADYDDPMASAMTPLLSQYWDKSGRALRGRLGLDPEEWRVTDPNLHKAIAEASLSFCAATNATTDRELGTALADLRRELHEGLVEQGEAIPRLVKRVRKVFARASKSRAVAIARTEAARAVHSAAEMSARQSGVVASKKWLTSANSCALCHKLADDVGAVALGGTFATVGQHAEYSAIRMPPAHPHCRCTVTFVLTDPAQDPAPAFVPSGPRQAPAPPEPRAKVDAFPADPDALKVVRRLGGSTGAELVEDADGRRFVRKRGASADHLREEHAADLAYRALGIAVPDSRLFETPGGPVKLARFVPGRSLAEVRRADPKLAALAEAEIRKGFAADALLGNWDVIGAGADNILVDAGGKPWRIDNGGSLRYRAQGSPKTPSQWGVDPVELWTMRDSKANANAAGVFGPLGFDQVAAQVDELAAKSRALARALPPDVARVVAGRLAQANDLVKVGRTLRADSFVEGYADDFAKHTCGLRAAGISARMPTEMRRPKGGGVEVVDQDGKPWDHLRGQGSLVTEVADYIRKAGGNYDAVRGYMAAQAGDSWKARPMALKSFLASNRSLPDSGYWWKVPPADCLSAYDRESKAQGGPGSYRTSMVAYHAFTRELLAKAQFPKKDAAKATIRLMRTEDRGVMVGAGLKPGDKSVKLRRGALESTSIYRKTSVYGTELTTQDVPIHRVFGCYWAEREPGSGGSGFLRDGENEFVAMLDDLPLDYGK